MAKNPIRLPVFEVVKAAWHKVKGSKKTFWALLGCSALVTLFEIIFDMSTRTVNSTGRTGWLIFGVILLFAILRLVIGYALAYVGIQRARDFPIRFGMIKDVLTWHVFFRIVGGMLLAMVVLLPAGILFCLPTILKISAIFAADYSGIMKLLTALIYIISMVLIVYLIIRMCLTQAIILINKVNPWTAIKLSFKATKSNVWRLIGLLLLNILILIASAIPIGMGLIWSLPYFVISLGEIYKKLVESRPELALENNL